MTRPSEAHEADTAGAHADEQAPRGTVRLFLDPVVGLYFAGKLLASVGIWIHNVVAAVVVYEVSRSALLVGAVSIAQFTPQVVLAPWMGALADRANRRKLVIFGRVLSGVGSLGLGLWLLFPATGSLTSGIPVVLSALVVGIGFAISIPALHAIVPALARPSELPSVMVITQSPLTLARAVGPAVGALLLVSFGAAVSFVAAGMCQVIFALIVWRLRLRPAKSHGDKDRSVFGALRYLRQDVAVALLLLAVTGVGFGVDPVITLSPPLAEAYGEGPRLVATMASAFGVGAAILVVFQGVVRRRIGLSRLGSGGLAVLGASLVALAASPTPAFAIASLVVGGMGMMAAITSLSTQIQQRIPDHLRGRIMALWAVCFVGSRPLAAAIDGALADYWSVDAALLVIAAILFACVYFSRPSRIARYKAPEESAVA